MKKPTQTYPCPTCRELIVYDERNVYRPFCSERCQINDRAAWAEEEYRIAAEAASNPSDEET